MRYPIAGVGYAKGFDTQGNIILNTNRTKTIINISDLNTGIYILKIHSEEFTINSKFLIDR